MDFEFETWFNVHNILSGGSLEDKRELFEDCWDSAQKDLLEVVDEKTILEDELEDTKYDVEDLTGKLSDVKKTLEKITEETPIEEILNELEWTVNDIEDTIRYYENN